MKPSEKVEFKVGLFVSLALLCSIFLLSKVVNHSGFHSEESYVLYAKITNIGSLKVKAPVKIGGVTVGSVQSIELDMEDYTPVVTLEMNKKYGLFPDSSSVDVLTSGLIGDQYIRFNVGFSDEDVDLLQDQDFIEDTKPAIQLEDLIGQFLYSMKE